MKMNKVEWTIVLILRHEYDLRIGILTKGSDRPFRWVPHAQSTDTKELIPSIQETLLVPISLIKYAEIEVLRTSPNRL